MFSTTLALLVSVYVTLVVAVYQPVQQYAGDTFFEGWNFFTGPDPTQGFVEFKSQSDATSAGLIKTQPGANGVQAFMGVDSTNVTPGGRPAVRIQTTETFNHALVIADIAHMPGGICGTWPAFWMIGADPWPVNGEIDIVEGVNDQTQNLMTLHTNEGVSLDATTGFAGSVVTPNCDINAPNQPANSGCSIKDNSDLTFGSNFNAQGGGVYATEWTSDVIQIWFFPRGQVPSDIQAGTPTPSPAWGQPTAFFQGNYDIDTHFKNMSIIFDTTFCGAFAGPTFLQSATCTAKAATCNDFVQNNPTAFTEAFWLVNSVNVFQDNGAPAPGAPASSTPAPTPSSASVPGSAPTGPPQSLLSGPPGAPTVTGGFLPVQSGVSMTPPLTMMAKKRSGGAVLPMWDS